MGYKGKIIHYISPTVWIWGKKRADVLAKTVDLLLTFFPFEKKHFSHTPLSVEYVGHPLVAKIDPSIEKRKKILAIFPGSRDKEIERNLKLQLNAAKKLLQLDPELKIKVSIAHSDHEQKIRSIAHGFPVSFCPAEQKEELMKECRIALATSGTVTLELALYETPAIVQFAVHPIDLFIVQKILRISLPFYCIVNIIKNQRIFPELFGPNLTEDQLFFWTQKIWFNPQVQQEIKEGCKEVRRALGEKNAKLEAAKQVISLAF